MYCISCISARKRSHWTFFNCCSFINSCQLGDRVSKVLNSLLNQYLFFLKICLSFSSRFTPKIPVVLYHGTIDDRAKIRARKFKKSHGVFPVIVTSYEIVINDRRHLKVQFCCCCCCCFCFLLSFSFCFPPIFFFFKKRTYVYRPSNGNTLWLMKDIESKI